MNRNEKTNNEARKETLMLTDVSEIVYNDFITDTYPQEEDIEYYFDQYHISQIEELLNSNPATMSNIDFVKKYGNHIIDGNLSSDFQQHDRMIITYLHKGKDILTAFSDDRLEMFRNRVVDRYFENPTGFMSQFYRNNENNQKMTSLFKEYVSGLDYFIDPSSFDFYPMTITTHDRDACLNQLVVEEYGYNISEKGIDAIAVSKSGHVFCIEAKFVGQGGGHQNNQIASAIQLAKQSNGKISGLAVIDGYPAYNTDEFSIIQRNYKEVMGRIITSYDLYKFLSEN